MLKKIYLFLSFCLFFVGLTNAQVIMRESPVSSGANSLAFIDGTSNPGYNVAGANYAGKGILFPSIDLTAALVGAPFDQSSVGGANYNPNYYDGLVVYNTGTGNSALGVAVAVAPGFYYYSNPGATAINTGTWLPLGSASAGKFIDGTDPLNAVYSAGNVGIGTDTPEGALDVASANSGVILPRVANVGSVTTPVNGTIVYDISSSCIRSYEGNAWSSCLSAGSNSSVVVDCDANGLIGTRFLTDVALTDQAYSVTVTNDSFAAITFAVAATDVVLSGSALGTVVVSDVTVSGASATSVTLAVGASELLTYTLAGTPVTGDLNISWSVNSLTCATTVPVNVGDADFTLPVLASILTINDGGVDIQGVVDNAANQIIVDIFYTGGFGTYAAYTSAVVNSAAGTGEAGDANGFTISYPAGTFAASGSIPVTITVDGDGTFNATRQLFGATEAIASMDFQANGNSKGAVILESFGGIPDRNFADADHKFIYVPVTGANGRLWLSNNLGANYANLNHAAFQPRAQATARTDFNAYGSFIQWGRFVDGHELIDWTSATLGTPVNGSSVGTSSTDDPGTTDFLISSYWRSPHNNNLWQGVDGVNNPCPEEYRVPTSGEMNTERASWSSFNSAGSFASPLKLSQPGYRGGPSGNLAGAGSDNRNWTSGININNNQNPPQITSTRLRIFSAAAVFFNSNRSEGYTVRCIRD